MGEFGFKSWELHFLALCAWREASKSGREGMRAVMQVVRNRVNAGWGTWADVIKAKWQFSSMSVLGDPNTVRWPAPNDGSFQVAILLAELVMRGDTDLTGGAVYYANLQYIDRAGWFQREVVGHPEKYPKTAEIGGHTFYKEIKA